MPCRSKIVEEKIRNVNMAWKESWLTKAQQLQVNGGKKPHLIYWCMNLSVCYHVRNLHLFIVFYKGLWKYTAVLVSQKTKQNKSKQTQQLIKSVMSVVDLWLIICFSHVLYLIKSSGFWSFFFFFNITIREKKKGLKHQSLLCGQTPANSRNPWFKHN